MRTDNLKSSKICSACYSEKATAIEESCKSNRFFACAQNDAGAQTGRSMLEMLGVLAIIGVLSVGAIMGFRQAMNRHKANVILNDVSLAFEELATHETTGAISRYQVTAFTPESGHTLYAKRDANGNDSVEVVGVAQGVCNVLIQYDKTELYTQISDTAGAKLTACADNQTMVFGLGIDDSDPDPGPGPECTFDDDCADGKECKNGKCECPSIGTPGVCQTTETQNGCSVLVNKTSGKCGTNGICTNGVCSECSSPMVANADGTACECPSIGNPGVCQTTEMQNGCSVLVNKTFGKCGSNGICTNGACSECSSPMIANADGTACVCPAKGANCKTQNGLTCECDLCEDGFEKNAAGECVEVSACAADTPVVCGTSCCPEGSTCDGDKCCLGGKCCDAGKTPRTCWWYPASSRANGAPSYRSTYCLGMDYKTKEEACEAHSIEHYGSLLEKDSPGVQSIPVVMGYTIQNNAYGKLRVYCMGKTPGPTISFEAEPMAGCYDD